MKLIISGNYPINTKELIKKYFPINEESLFKNEIPKPILLNQKSFKIKVNKKEKLEQTHIAIALETFNMYDERRYTLDILTNILVPGFFPANQNKKILNEERKKKILMNTPLGWYGNQKFELVGIVKYLLSEESSFMNGSEIVIDGGYSITKI